MTAPEHGVIVVRWCVRTNGCSLKYVKVHGNKILRLSTSGYSDAVCKINKMYEKRCNFLWIVTAVPACWYWRLHDWHVEVAPSPPVLWWSISWFNMKTTNGISNTFDGNCLHTNELQHEDVVACDTQPCRLMLYLFSNSVGERMFYICLLSQIQMQSFKKYLVFYCFLTLLLLSVDIYLFQLVK